MTPVSFPPPRRWGGLALWMALALLPAPAAADGTQGLPLALEGGLIAEASLEAAYLAELWVVLGHYLAARDLFAKNDLDQSRTLAGHPEDEASLPDLVAEIESRGAEDPRPLILAYRQTLGGSDLQAVDASLARLTTAFDRAAALAPAPRARRDAVILILQASAGEYGVAIDDNAVIDPMSWHEAWAFLTLARAELTQMGAVTPAAARALAALSPAEALFGDPLAPDLQAGDPQILWGIAAQVALLTNPGP